MEDIHVAMLGTAVIAALFSGSVVLYQWIRSQFPVTVNCHFCNENTKVPYGNAECWDCPNCEQYNGFTKDGHYNKDIPAQHNEDLNHPISAESRRPDPISDVTAPSILCDKCSRNQILKVRLLAHFIPHEESNFDAEVEAYQSHLEYEYRLCRQCEHKVARTLNTQDSKLQRNLEDSNLSTSGLGLNDTSYIQEKPTYCRLPELLVVRMLRSLIILLAFTVFVTDFYNMMGQSKLAWWEEEEEEEGGGSLGRSIYSLNLGLVLLALCVNILTVCLSGKERLGQVDAVCCLLMMVELVLHSPVLTESWEDSNVYLLQTAAAFLTLTLTVTCAAAPRYLKAASPTRILKRTLRRNLRADTSANSSLSYDVSPATQPAESVHRGRDTSNMSNDVFTKPLPPRDPRDEPARPPPTPQLDELGTLRIGTPMRERPPRVHGRFMFDFPQNQSLSANLFTAPTAPAPASPTVTGLHHQRRPIISPARFTPVLTKDRLAPPSPSLHCYHDNGYPPNTSTVPPTGSRAGDHMSLYSDTRSHGNQEDSSEGSASSNAPTASSVCPVGTTSRDDGDRNIKGVSSSGHPWLLGLLLLVTLASIIINISFYLRLDLTPSWLSIDFSTFLFS